MRQRGRKSAAALSVIAVDGKPDRLLPPASLSDADRTVFVDLVTTCDPTHFQPSDLRLLCRYCEAPVLAEQAALELRRGAVVDGKPSPWITIQEKAVRAMVSLSMRLRLSPQSRIDPKTLGRKQAYTGPLPRDLSGD
jgi:phage terminase small subunit